MSTPGSVIETLPIDLSLVEPYTVSSADGSVQHWVTADTTDPSKTTITAETRFPEGMEWFSITNALDPTPIDTREFDNPETELILRSTPSGAIYDFADIRRFATALHALGYQWNSVKASKDSVTTQHATFTYPSVGSFNARAEQVFPSTPLRLKTFEGGHFTTEDFLAPLAEEGAVIVPSEQPWQLHDHAVKHILGFVAMGEDFVEPMQAAIKEWLVRNKVEAALPIAAGVTDERVKRFLRPSQAILHLLTEKLDMHTAQIADILLADETATQQSRRLYSRLGSLSHMLEMFWNNGSRMGARLEVPSYFMGQQPSGFFTETAITMWDRFETAERNAAILLNGEEQSYVS